MISAKEIVDAVAREIKDEFGYRIYHNETTEGFKAPCCFCSYHFKSFDAVKPRLFQISGLCEAVFFPEIKNGKVVRSEEQALDFMTRISPRLIPKLRVKDRYLTSSQLNFSFGGTNGDILRLSFDLDYYDGIEETESDEKIREIVLGIDLAHGADFSSIGGVSRENRI